MEQGISLEESKEQVGKGWWGLLDFLYSIIPEDTIVEQVKEKFGGLRFYTDAMDENFMKQAYIIENVSYHICEQCGMLGKLRDIHGWYKTLCDEHYEEAMKE